MARGKYKERGAYKRAAAEAEADLGTYQHRVKKLTEENRALKEKLQQAEQRRQQETRTLKAQRDEGLAPKVQVLQDQARGLRERAERAEREHKEISRRWDNAIWRLADHFTVAPHSLPRHQAMETALGIIGVWEEGNARGWRNDETGPSAKSDEATERIERARGHRR